MPVSVAPAHAGDSLSTSTPTSSAPRLRGRPRKHFASEGRTAASARKAAYRARQRVKKDRNEKRALRRLIARMQAVDALKPTAKHLKLTNKILSALGYGMTSGEFLTDAPSGAGQLVSGGYDGEKLSFIEEKNGGEVIQLADGRFAQLHNGREAEPKGWGSGKHEETKIKAKQIDPAFDTRFIDAQKFPLKWEISPEQEELLPTTVVKTKPGCHECGAPAVAIHTEDQRKKLADARFLCDQHAVAA
jgi:hypothetical protein